MAALFVDPAGTYCDVAGVDVWDESRDARRYAGPFPVVAHPPCARWCSFAGLVEARWGHRRGDDDGCFAAALAAVRAYGGLLEHPAYSHAWPAFSLPVPLSSGGWTGDLFGGWSAYVEQWRYGHPARKATWLYAVGIELPDLEWGRSARSSGSMVVSRALNKSHPDDGRTRCGPRLASSTPRAFRDVLLAAAATAAPRSRRTAARRRGLA